MEIQTSIPFIPHPICFGDAAGTLIRDLLPSEHDFSTRKRSYLTAE